MSKGNSVFKVKKIKVPIYESSFTLIIFKNNWAEVIAFLKKEGFDTSEYDDFNVHGLVINEDIKGITRIVILLDDSVSAPFTLVHEVHHLTQVFLESCGVNYIQSGDNEPHAYMQEFLYKEIYKHLTRYDRKEKKEVQGLPGGEISLGEGDVQGV